MQLLIDPRGPALPSRATDDDLAIVYAFPEDRPWWRANMVTTLDGAVAGSDGRSGSVNTPADNRVFALQRDLCDVVLVGAGTARAERYGRVAPTRRAPQPAPLAVVTRSGRVPDDLLEPSPRRGDLIVVTCEAAGADRLHPLRTAVGVLVCGAERVDLVAAMTRLTALGLRGVLCEGGPSLLAEAFAAGVVDELSLTLAPAVVGGDAARMTSGPTLGDAKGITAMPYLLAEEDGTLLGLWRTLHR
jgi:riboflavin biosynthesis pyrimidine reductase